MPKTNRAYKSAKRNKEISRQKKAEEKRKRKLERAALGLPSGPPIEGITEYPEDVTVGETEAEPGDEPETGSETPDQS
ncbi:MAG: hypothetical protein PHI34_06725 [Acidobacteriota bacterium]|nr:hypothetical protein [Acidobacteriota bacterium]